MTPYMPFSVKVRLPKPDHGLKRLYKQSKKGLYRKEADLMSGSIKELAEKMI